MADSPAIGIDLGTTYCCVGYMSSETNIDIIKNQFGHRTTPSYVFFNDSEVLIGKSAKEEVYMTGENVVYDSKRLIGQNFDSKNVQRNLRSWPFEVVSDGNNKPLIKVSVCGRGITYQPEQISAKLLGYMKKAAEDRLDCKITNAVITVPAYFNYHQRTATERAGEMAGLNVLRIINEPTAAALAYVHGSRAKGRRNLLISDLGGGTFDVSIVTANDNTNITVKATSGNTYLGGRDFDDNLAEFIATQLENKYGVSLLSDKDTMRRIRARSEKIKVDLSEQREVQYDILGLIPRTTDAYHKIRREDFERINEKFFDECLNIVKDCLKDAGLNKNEIDKVILTGGSSRIPKVQDMLTRFFGDKLSKGVDPDEAVAYGAAIQAAMLTDEDTKAIVPKIIDITPLSLGTEVFGDEMDVVIQRNSQIPISKTKKYYTTADGQTSIALNIFEGERSLIQHNTKIGSCRLKLPPQPPGYPIDVTFHVNENGVLEISAKSEGGEYTKLAIDYEKQDVEAISDILREAKLNEAKDKKVSDVISKWRSLSHYCEKVKSLCKYDNKYLTGAERDNCATIANVTMNWADKNKVKLGTEEEENAILEKQRRIEEICEPIFKKYDFKIKDVHLSEFYNFIVEIQNK